MSDLDTFINQLGTLVGYQTVVCRNPEEFAKATQWICDFVDGATIDDFDCNGLQSLLIHGPGSQRPGMVADCHIEVVPAQAGQFELQRDGDRLVGRGTMDMKTQTLAVLWAFRELLEEDDTAGDVWIAITQDEEVGARAGAAVLIDHLKTNDMLPPVAFVPDGGADFAYVEKEKGILTLRVRAEGSAVHGSRPWLGRNAIDAITTLASDLYSRWPDPDGESDWRNSAVLTQLHGGSASNRVPQEAEGTIDVRFTEDWSLEDIRDEVLGMAAERGVEVEVVGEGPATYYPQEADIAVAYLDLLREAADGDVEIIHSAGASNGRLWAAAGNVHVLMSNPTGGGAHSAGEWVAVESIDPYVELVRQTFRLKTDA